MCKLDPPYCGRMETFIFIRVGFRDLYPLAGFTPILASFQILVIFIRKVNVEVRDWFRAVKAVVRCRTVAIEAV